MRIDLPSGTPAELIGPPVASPARGVVIAPDIMGLRPLFSDLAGRLAREHEWAVCVVEPFPGRESLPLPERMTAMAGVVDEEQVRDLVDAADALALDPVGIIGFCMGGMYAMKAATTGRFDRVASFYGMVRVPPAWRGPRQRDAVEGLRADRSAAERVLLLTGTEDPYVPAEHAAELEAAGGTVVTYPGAEHGFAHDDSRPTHRPEDAADCWNRTAEWLKT
jgi:carboxymethylenebutenolidase